MKKKLISLSAVLLLVAPLCVFLWSLREPPEREVLSELPDQQILKFLAFYEIEIPEELKKEIKNEENLIRAVRSWIVKTEDNPKVSFGHYSRRCLYDLSNAIKKAVNDYYGVFP